MGKGLFKVILLYPLIEKGLSNKQIKRLKGDFPIQLRKGQVYKDICIQMRFLGKTFSTLYCLLYVNTFIYLGQFIIIP